MMTWQAYNDADNRIMELVTPEAAGAALDISDDHTLHFRAPSGTQITLGALDFWALVVLLSYHGGNLITTLDNVTKELHPNYARYVAEGDALDAEWERWKPAHLAQCAAEQAARNAERTEAERIKHAEQEAQKVAWLRDQPQRAGFVAGRVVHVIEELGTLAPVKAARTLELLCIVADVAEEWRTRARAQAAPATPA